MTVEGLEVPGPGLTVERNAMTMARSTSLRTDFAAVKVRAALAALG